LSRLGSQKLINLADLNCQEYDAFNNSNIGYKRQPVTSFGPVPVQSLRKKNTTSKDLSMAALGCVNR
jgi:hypothetical protein